jgi:hypothetical protein
MAEYNNFVPNGDIARLDGIKIDANGRPEILFRIKGLRTSAGPAGTLSPPGENRSLAGGPARNEGRPNWSYQTAERLDYDDIRVPPGGEAGAL